MQVDIAPEGDHPPLEENFTIESATFIGKPLHLSFKTTYIFFFHHSISVGDEEENKKKSNSDLP